MSEGMNINRFKLSGDGISLSEFSAMVGNDKDLINIYKAFDKNGDNKLANDELASLLGAYKMLDNGDNSLSLRERNKFEKQIESGLANDKNVSNDGIKIKGKKLNKFFAAINKFVDPNSSEDGYVYNYNTKGQITSGKDSLGEFSREYTDSGFADTFADGTKYFYKDGEWVGGEDETEGDKWTFIYNDDRSYTVKYDTYNGDTNTPYEEYHTADGKLTGGIDTRGDKYTRTYNDDGSFTNKYESYNGDTNTPYEEYYNADGKLVGGIDTNGDKYARTYNDDGSYADKFDSFLGDTLETYEKYYNVDGSYKETYYNADKLKSCERYFNADGTLTGGIHDSGLKYTIIYNDDGTLIYHEEIKPDGSRDFAQCEIENGWVANPIGIHTNIDPQGNIKTTAIEGESFNATMARLGITEAADIELFKKSNPKAARKGYFLAGVQDVKIPAELAQKLDVANMMVNKDEQLEAYKRRISGS